jgi:hypothetical protein
VSELVKDQEVVQEGRRAPLEDVAAPLRDQLVKKLFKKLEEQEIAAKVEKVWTAGNANRNAWLERQHTYLQSWDDHLVSEVEGPFAGSSNLHMPITFIVSKALHARYMQALWGDVPCHTKANNEASVDRVPVVQDTMRFYLQRGCNRGQGAGKAADLFVWKWLTQGSAIGKVRWETQYTRFWDVEEVMEEGPPRWAVDPATGEQVRVPNPVTVEREVERTKKCVDAPRIETIAPEDVLIVGGAGDIDEADAVLHRDYVTASTLWTAVDRKVFDKKAVEGVIASGGDRLDGADNSFMKQQQADNAGTGVLGGDEKLDRYEVIEAHLKLDIDGSGITTDIVAWVHLRTKTLLGCTFLHRIMKSGERPFFKADYHLREGQDMGVGIPELLYPIQKEIDAMHNMRIDFGMISTMPFGFYRATSGIDPETIKFEPGTLIPTDNPQADVYFPQLGNRSVFGMQEEAALDGLIQRLTGINDLALGSMSSQGATRTASGARLLAGEMSANLDVHLRRLNWGWQKALNLLLHMLQQRIPAGVSFRLTGDDGRDYWRTVRAPGELGQAADFDIEVSPLSASSNAGIRQQQALEILQLVSNPLAIQLGIVTPSEFYEAYRNRLQALEVRDFGRYARKPQGQSIQLAPMEEASRVLRGIPVPVSPEQDHAGFIAVAEEILNSDELLGQFNEEQAQALELQRRRHVQMAEAIEQMAAQQANAQQMQMNASLSAEQAPTAAPQAMPQAPGAPSV